MLAAVKGYYDGTQIVLNEDDRKNFNTGDKVIVTILDKKVGKQTDETRAEKRKHLIDSDAFVMPTGRTAEEIERYIREMRENDRI